MQGIDCRARDPDEVYEMWRRGTGAGFRRARYVGFLGLIAGHYAGLDGEDAGSSGFLSNNAADYSVRDSVLLGSAHDNVRLPFHAGTRAGCGNQEGQWVGRQEG